LKEKRQNKTKLDIFKSSFFSCSNLKSPHISIICSVAGSEQVLNSWWDTNRTGADNCFLHIHGYQIFIHSRSVCTHWNKYIRLYLYTTENLGRPLPGDNQLNTAEVKKTMPSYTCKDPFVFTRGWLLHKENLLGPGVSELNCELKQCHSGISKILWLLTYIFLQEQFCFSNLSFWHTTANIIVQTGSRQSFSAFSQAEVGDAGK